MYLSCLSQVNESVRESKFADFEFTDPREAVIFAQFTEALLPIDIESYFKLERELGEYIMGYGYNPLLSQPAWSNERSLLQERKYVRFVKLTRVVGDDFWFDEFAYKREIETLEKEGLDPKKFVFYDLDKKTFPTYDESSGNISGAVV